MPGHQPPGGWRHSVADHAALMAAAHVRDAAGSPAAALTRLPGRAQTGEDHVHWQDFPGQRIEHQAERFECHGSEECSVVFFAQHDGDVAALSRISKRHSETPRSIGVPSANVNSTWRSGLSRSARQVSSGSTE